MGIKINNGDSGVGVTSDEGIRPPNPVEEIAKLLETMKPSRRWPGMFPDLPIDAAAFWISTQEKCGVREGAERVIIPKKKWDQEEVNYRFEYPYIERLKANLRSFMTEAPESQRYIMAAIEDGVPYRGDDNKIKYKQFGGLTMFQNIVKETEKMRETGVKKYARETMDKVLSCKDRMVV